MITALLIIAVALVVFFVWCAVVPPAAPLPRPEPPRDAPCCGGMAGGCPFCLAIGVAGGLLLGSWLDGE